MINLTNNNQCFSLIDSINPQLQSKLFQLPESVLTKIIEKMKDREASMLILTCRKFKILQESRIQKIMSVNTKLIEIVFPNMDFKKICDHTKDLVGKGFGNVKPINHPLRVQGSIGMYLLEYLGELIFFQLVSGHKWALDGADVLLVPKWAISQFFKKYTNNSSIKEIHFLNISSKDIFDQLRKYKHYQGSLLDACVNLKTIKFIDDPILEGDKLHYKTVYSCSPLHFVWKHVLPLMDVSSKDSVIDDDPLIREEKKTILDTSLSRSGGDINVLDSNGLSILHNFFNQNISDYLLNKKINPDIPDKNGGTPICYLLLMINIKRKLLVQKFISTFKPNLGLYNKKGLTYLQILEHSVKLIDQFWEENNRHLKTFKVAPNITKEEWIIQTNEIIEIIKDYNDPHQDAKRRRLN